MQTARRNASSNLGLMINPLPQHPTPIQPMTILRQPPPGFVSVLVPIVSVNYERSPSSPNFLVGSVPSCLLSPPQALPWQGYDVKKLITNNSAGLKPLTSNVGRLSPLPESEEFLQNDDEMMPRNETTTPPGPSPPASIIGCSSSISSAGEGSSSSLSTTSSVSSSDASSSNRNNVDMGTQTVRNYDDSDDDIRQIMKEERLKRRKKLMALKNRPPKITILKSVKTSEGVKLECEMETAKKQLVLFEFSTEDVVPEDVASQFISGHLMKEKHKPFVIETLNQIICQHKS